MGRSRYKIDEPTHPHFVTCTVLHWLQRDFGDLNCSMRSTSGEVKRDQPLTTRMPYSWHVKIPLKSHSFSLYSTVNVYHRDINKIFFSTHKEFYEYTSKCRQTCTQRDFDKHPRAYLELLHQKARRFEQCTKGELRNLGT